MYPAGATGTFSTRQVYNAFGYLKEVRHWIASDDGKPTSQLQGKVYWMADSYAVTGQISGETYGNGLANDRAFSEVTGRLVRATIDRGSVVTAPFFVQDLNYAYDAVGNVKSRIEYTTGFNREEHFSFANGADGYDGLDRLLVHRVVGGATVNVTYGTNGNIASKSDVGSYSYYTNRPHAVEVAGANTYTYDAVGNMLTGAGRSLEWTSFNQLKKVTQGTLSSEFAFGAGHERVLQIRRTSGTVTDRTAYVGGLYERVHSTGGLIEHKHYIMGPTGRIAIYTDRSDLTKDTRWFHTDGLGSITVITDESGRVLKRHTYDAWGKQSTSYTNTGSGITNTSPSTRGYTDHEMLGDFGLIHMNGRVYDPVLGRFLSADPNVDGVEDAQGYNKYSYVGNNPMNATDPSGYFSFKDLVKIVAIVVVGVVTAGAALAAFTSLGFAGGIGAMFGAAGAASLTLGQAIIAGAAFGFGSSFAGSLLNGGSIGDAFKAGLIGGIVGGISAGIAHGIGTMAKAGKWGWELKAAAHGLAQGGLTEATGGEFRHGFYAGFFSSAAASSGFIDGAPGGSVGRTAAAAVVGGTASAIGGGKFANGAVSGAFIQMFNDSQHKLAEADVKNQAAAIRNKMATFIKGHPGETMTISRAEFDTLQLATAYKVRDAGLDKISWGSFKEYLKHADTDFYRILGAGENGNGLRTSTVRFQIEGLGTYYGGEINYYMQGMAWTARTGGQYWSSLPRAASINYWNIWEQHGWNNFNQIGPALRWASQGSSAYYHGIIKK